MEQIKNIMLNCGAADVGFCDFSFVRDRLIPCSAARRLPKDASTVIVAVFPYKVKAAPPENICRYAAVPDYHTVCGDILKNAAAKLSSLYSENQFEVFIDNSPLPEVFTAAKAGLGVIGDNGLLIHQKYGSYVFLGEIVTDLRFDLADIEIKHCNRCGKCAKVCPVGLNKENCISKITQQKQDLTPQQAQLIKENGCVWGCDICAIVCPENKDKAFTDIDAFVSGYRHRYTLGEDIIGRAYAWRGKKIISRNAQLLEPKK